MPSFMKDPAFPKRVIGIESNFGKYNNAPGSSYSGLIQASLTDVNSLYRDNLTEIRDFMNAAKPPIPALKNLRQEKIATAQNALNTAHAESQTLQKEWTSLKKAPASKKNAPAQKIAKESIRLNLEKRKACEKALKLAQTAKDYPVTEETLLNKTVFADKDFQVFTLFTLAHITHRDILSKNTNFHKLNDKAKIAAAYLAHNSPVLVDISLNNLGNKKDSIAKLAAEQRPELAKKFPAIFLGNPNIYGKYGEATPEEVLQRILALSSLFAQAFPEQSNAHMPPRPTQQKQPQGTKYTVALK